MRIDPVIVLRSSLRTACPLSFVAAAQTDGSLQGRDGSLRSASSPERPSPCRRSDGTTTTVQSGADGAYAFPQLAPGTYTITVTARASLSRQARVCRLMRAAQCCKTSPSHRRRPAAGHGHRSGAGLDTSPDNNAGAIVIKGKDLDALSDDPDELQDELNALAGPAAGPNGGQIYIDGFTGGQLPPKSSIREIRINQNPFSAQYDKLGYGRIEILTKPGTDKLHGIDHDQRQRFRLQLTQHLCHQRAALLLDLLSWATSAARSTARTSWFVSGFRRDNNANSIINAAIARSNGRNLTTTPRQFANPQSRLD